MEKIISLFKRDYEGTHLIFNEIVPGAEWVAAGEGVATRKFDGTCCRVLTGKLYKRYDLKAGKKAPPGFEPAQEPDPVTGHCPGWILVGEGPDDKYHREAFGYAPGAADLNHPLNAHFWVDGTYELCGPKIQGNPERLEKHTFVAHGSVVITDAPRTFDALREWLKGRDIEGIVWHHPEKGMVKIKKKDFGMNRGD